MMLHDSVEVDELNYPIRVLAQRLMPDTEGPGRRRGTPSALVEFGPVDCELRAAYGSDGTQTPARGARGGGDGSPAQQFKRTTEGKLEPLPAVASPTLAPGETIVSVSAGGAGYGDPLERDVERVAHDVREGWITAERAERVYGVVVDASGSPNQEATARLRGR
jgi:N-methylhydantoinase B